MNYFKFRFLVRFSPDFSRLVGNENKLTPNIFSYDFQLDFKIFFKISAYLLKIPYKNANKGKGDVSLFPFIAPK